MPDNTRPAGSALVMRRWTTGLLADRTDAYETFAREISLPMFQQLDGLVAVFMSRSDSYATVNTVWRDRQAIERAEASPIYQETVRRILAAGVLAPPQTTIVEDMHLTWMKESL